MVQYYLMQAFAARKGLPQYVRVYREGLNEVGQFLLGRPLFPGK
jgi:hypothetical protein